MTQGQTRSAEPHKPPHRQFCISLTQPELHGLLFQKLLACTHGQKKSLLGQSSKHVQEANPSKGGLSSHQDKCTPHSHIIQAIETWLQDACFGNPVSSTLWNLHRFHQWTVCSARQKKRYWIIINRLVITWELVIYCTSNSRATSWLLPIMASVTACLSVKKTVADISQMVSRTSSTRWWEEIGVSPLFDKFCCWFGSQNALDRKHIWKRELRELVLLLDGHI